MARMQEDKKEKCDYMNNLTCLVCGGIAGIFYLTILHFINKNLNKRADEPL